jgi:pimeloyl-ACP methyl ester carboxylesterase
MVGSLALAAAVCASTQAPAALDTSPHRSALVAIRADVHLEVLDWGGHGPALVFLAGFGDTAHVFDGFAPQFTDRFHVFGITRRGFGASSRPAAGYDTRTLAQDITLALDSLGVDRAAFVGHSFAGTELSYLGAFYGDRVSHLVYLDASYDFASLYADPRWKRAYPIPRPPLPRTPEMAAWQEWFTLTLGPGFPPAEIRILNATGSRDSLADILQRSTAPSDFRRIRSPVLALWAAPTSVQEQYPYWKILDSAARARLEESFALTQAVRRVHLRRFGQLVRGARILRIPGGRHYLFLSHPAEVTRAIRAFLPS